MSFPNLTLLGLSSQWNVSQTLESAGQNERRYTAIQSTDSITDLRSLTTQDHQSMTCPAHCPWRQPFSEEIYGNKTSLYRQLN